MLCKQDINTDITPIPITFESAYNQVESYIVGSVLLYSNNTHMPQRVGPFLKR